MVEDTLVTQVVTQTHAVGKFSKNRHILVFSTRKVPQFLHSEVSREI